MAVASSQAAWGDLQSQLDKDFNMVHQGQAWLLNHFSGLVMAVFYLFFFTLLWFVLSRFFRVVFKRTQLNETAANFVQEILKYFLLCVGALSILGALGVNTASLLASLGVLGLTLGFAARDTLSNLIAGIFILSGKLTQKR